MSSPLRTTLSESLKASMHAKEVIKTATIRLVMAAIKDRDISARSKGNSEGISDDEILSLFQTMIKQRNESIKMYSDGGRQELADREAQEIDVIHLFMPAQLSDDDIASVVADAIKQVEAASVKDMGRVMAVLKDKYAGQMDFSKASQMVKGKLL